MLAILVILPGLLGLPETAHAQGFSRSSPLLLVVSMDGFRHDYVNRTELPNIQSLMGNGSHVVRLRSVFPPKTFPNHYTIVTGRYPEDHGVVSNMMYDPLTRKRLYINSSDFFTYDSSIFPIWVSNEMAYPGRASGSMMWIGMGHPLNRHFLTYQEEYDRNMPWRRRVDIVMSWFLNPLKPANLAFLYVEEPDATGHFYGPDSSEIVKTLRKLDDLVGYLLRRIQEEGLSGMLNLILLTDHGMHPTPETQKIFLDRTSARHTFYGGSPVLNTLLKREICRRDLQLEHLDVASEQARPFSVYCRGEVPLHYHYDNNRRILDAVLEAWPGYSFVFNDQPPAGGRLGDHGYDPKLDEMHGFLVGYGPAFLEGAVIPWAFNLDVYPLMCEILRIVPLPHNGTLNLASQILKSTVAWQQDMTSFGPSKGRAGPEEAAREQNKPAALGG